MVSVQYNRRPIARVNLVLDDLLERQNNNQTEYTTEFLTFNINLLLHLLNRDFLTTTRKRKFTL